jgi:DNA polymerase I-like protein with 3'-5' exonuclease and polymerase domains
MQRLFYEDLHQPVVKKRGTGKPTLDGDTLKNIARREPILKPLIRNILEFRSLRTFRSTFVEARLDIDNRVRSSLNPAGTETFRFASSESAFWNGINLQNIPPGGGDMEDEDFMVLPNVRKLFIPDPGFTIGEVDLAGADFQVVVWEADDEEFRTALAEGLDIHGLNAIVLFGLKCEPEQVKERYNPQRQLAKRWVHGTDYGGGDKTMAASCGLTIHENQKLRQRWFSQHPGIAEWHRRTESQLRSTRTVTNRFGYRRFYFDRVEGILPEALAWVPQSTVAVVTHHIWAELVTSTPVVQPLFPVHDSLLFQWPTSHSGIPALVQECARRVVVPYEKPLIIPISLKSSVKSWGDCQ